MFGVLQGIFEWLPISSTGELVIIMTQFFDYAAERALGLSFLLHIGTSFSAIVYFRKDVRNILIQLPKYKPRFNEGNKLVSFLIISTIISGVLGVIVYKLTEELVFSGEILLAVVGIALIITGIVQKFSKQDGKKSATDITLNDSILLGVVQAFSAIPGLSRSGITVSAFLFRGYTGKDSLRLSFLMGIPAVLGAQVGLIAINGIPEITVEFVVALFSAFIVGYFSISLLLKLAAKISFWLFTIIIGSLALLSFIGLF